MRRRLREYDALLLAALVWFLAKFLRYAFPPLFETFQATYGVSNTVVGTAFSALMVAYAAMQFPSGVLADRFGPVRVITAGAVVAGLGSAAVVLADPFPALVAGMLLVGAGTGAHKTVAVRLLSVTYPARTGRAIGVLDTVAIFGGVAAPAAVAYALPDWRGVFLAGAVAAVVLAAAFAVSAARRVPAPDDRPDGSQDGGHTGLRAYARAVRRPRVAVFVGVTVAVSFGYNGAVAFLPLYLAEVARLPATAASLLYSGLFAVGLVQLVTGELADRAGRLRALLITVATAAGGLAAVVALGDAPTLLVAGAVVVFGLGGHGYRPVRSTYLMEVLPDEVAGGGLGVVRTVLMTSAAVSPAVTGALADLFGFRAAFGVLSGSLGLAAALLVVLWLGR